MNTLQPCTFGARSACPAHSPSSRHRFNSSRPTQRSTRRLSVRGSAETQENLSNAETSAAPKTCKTCGVSLSEVPRGCDQEGRIAGGIGAVLGFDWWPIKAYRPCPAAAKAGFLYTRKGQITDEMLFGDRKRKE